MRADNKMGYQSIAPETGLANDIDALENIVHQENISNASAFGRFATVMGIGSLAAVVIFAARLNMQHKYLDPPMLATEESSWSPLDFYGVYSIYKHTTSVPAGSRYNVSDFFSTYISDPVQLYDIGCNESFKAVGRLTAPVASGDFSAYIAFDEVHFVDSSVFVSEGPSIDEWASYFASLGYDEFNTFMHNKLQMYVPDLSEHYKRLSADGIEVILRLSCSDGSGEHDTAHIGIPIPEASNIYEIVGPFSSLSWLPTNESSLFVPWGRTECPISHQLAYNLTYYQTLFSTASGALSTVTGMYIPMGISISTPTQSIDYISDTLNILSSITGSSVDVSYATECAVASIDFSTDYTFGPTVRYVVNKAANQGTTYTVADWEEQVSLTHSSILDKSLYYSKWDRYLDTHIGVAYNSYDIDDDEECTVSDDLLSILNSSVQDPSYSYRMNHYYVGTVGLKSWEFHLQNHRCKSKLFPVTYANTDICGCIADNNLAEYTLDTGLDSCT